MKLQITFYLIILSCTIGVSQIRAYKEFSKDIALFKAKSYLFKEILGLSPGITQFEAISLAASNSGELTTLIYKCEKHQKEGLILGFYGDYWNEEGVTFQGYAFRNFDKTQARDFLTKIQYAIDENKKYLDKDVGNNNIYFKYDDMVVLVWTNYQSYSIRLFWKEFDSTWEEVAFERSKKRFEKNMK